MYFLQSHPGNDYMVNQKDLSVAIWHMHNTNLVFGTYQKTTRNRLSHHPPAVGANCSATFIILDKLHNILIVFFFSYIMKQRVLRLSRSPQKRSR